MPGAEYTEKRGRILPRQASEFFTPRRGERHGLASPATGVGFMQAHKTIKPEKERKA